MTRLGRFMAKVMRPGWDDCWLWVGATSDTGYGTFWSGERQVMAHRWSYEHFVGPIPEGLQIDHLCRTPACVRPDHLEPVTPLENSQRGKGSITHCKQGHEFTPENTHIRKTGHRVCRTCRRENMARYYKERK